MKLMNFYLDKEVHVGVVTEQGVADLTAAVNACECEDCKALGKMETLIAAGEEGKKKAAQIAQEAKKLNLDDLTFAPVVTEPEKIFCIGLNYLAHAMEGGGRLPVVPEVFSKFNTALAAHNESIPLPAAGSRFDYEAELVIVIGKQAKCVSKEEALDYVYGYTVGNDLTAREQQGRVSQWLIGKSPDKFGPVGALHCHEGRHRRRQFAHSSVVQWGVASGFQHQRPDLRHSDHCQLHLPVCHHEAGRSDLHRHLCRRHQRHEARTRSKALA